MIEVFKKVIIFYHLEAAIYPNFDAFSVTTKGNKYKLSCVRREHRPTRCRCFAIVTLRLIS